MLPTHEAFDQPPDYHILIKGTQMPRKASGTTKANAKGGAIAADGTHILNSNELPNATTGGNTPVRGGSSTRGAKRRRTSNNVNSSGTEIYGSGTIIAANPFDDDHGVSTITNHTGPMTLPNKMMVMSPSQPGMQIPHPQHHHHQQQQHFNQQQHAHPHPQHHHHSQQHPHNQQHNPPSIPMHHQHQVYSPHQHNNHYNTMQQPMSIHSHAQMNTPPGHMAVPLPPQMHQDHVAHQQHPPPMHNHGNMMSVQHHQTYGPPPLPNQQQTHMIGTSTPPHMMSGPAPSHSPYSTMHHQQGSMIAPPHQTLTPQPQSVVAGGPTVVACQQQQPPPPHHLEQMSLQQQPPYATNHNVYCGKCQREVYQNEPNIICKAGCKLYFHISCSGLTPLACDLLLKESLAEWACDRCTSGTRRVPFVKYKT